MAVTIFEDLQDELGLDTLPDSVRTLARGDNYGGRLDRPSGPVAGRGEAPTGERV